MDADRYVAENRDARIQEIREKKPHLANVPAEKINYRLIQEWELPEWIDAAEKEEEKDETKILLGKRKRNEVNYKETSDTQFFKQN